MDFETDIGASEPIGTETSGHNPGRGGRGRGRGKQTSDVWKDFDLVYKYDDIGNMVEHGICKKCKHSYSVSSSNGTTHMRRHSLRCRSRNVTLDLSQPTLHQTLEGNLGTFTYDPVRARKQHALYIASAQLPVNLGEDPYFEEYIRCAYNPQFKAFSKNTTRSDTLELFTEMRTKLIEEMSSFHASVACTFDIWTGRNRVCYICVTAHYVDTNWEFQKRLLAFRQIHYPHDAQAIYNSIMSVFNMYGIKDKVLSLTFDNAFANIAAVNLFKQTLKPLHGGTFFHQQCACNIINFVVQDGFKQFEQYLDNVRNAIGFVRGSPAKQQEFATACQRFDLPPKILLTDVNTKWNATYLMLEAALPYKEVINVVYNASIGTPGELTDVDWQICECFYHFLKVFYDSAVCLSGVYYPTSHHAIHKLYGMTFQFELYREAPIFADVVAFVETKLKKYWEKIPWVYCVAAVLDPRMKLSGVESLMRGINEKFSFKLNFSIQDVRRKMTKMFEHYNEKFGVASATQTTSSYNVVIASSASWQAVFNNPGFNYASSSSSSRLELKNYLETNFSAFFIGPNGNIDFNNFDLLKFWKGQSITFPVLSRMARDILTIPVSTVASEQVFSQSGRVLEERRAMLSEDILEAQMCIKDWEDARRRGQEFIDDMLGEFRDLGLL